MQSYYDRTPDTVDGTTGFQNGQDRRNEARVSEVLELRWRCTIHPYPRFHPIDFYAEREGAMVAALELKSRSHVAGKYPTVFLNYAKYITLLNSWIFTQVPSLFVVRFQDGELRYIRIEDVPVKKVSLRGCKKVVKAYSDVNEPVIEVPVNDMRQVL